MNYVKFVQVEREKEIPYLGIIVYEHPHDAKYGGKKIDHKH